MATQSDQTSDDMVDYAEVEFCLGEGRRQLSGCDALIMHCLLSRPDGVTRTDMLKMIPAPAVFSASRSIQRLRQLGLDIEMTRERGENVLLRPATQVRYQLFGPIDIGHWYVQTK
jgi:hypothetical protein